MFFSHASPSGVEVDHAFFFFLFQLTFLQASTRHRCAAEQLHTPDRKYIKPLDTKGSGDVTAKGLQLHTRHVEEVRLKVLSVVLKLIALSGLWNL